MKPAFPLAAASLALALAGCSSAPQNAPAPNFTQVEAAAGDALLTTEVKAKLITVDINSTTSLGVRVSDGVATLSGSVRTTAARAQMVAAARSVKGVTEVVDQLRVDPHLPDIRQRLGQAGQQLSDAALAGRIAGAIFTQTGTTGVKVDVHDGNVILRGNIVDPKVRTAAVDTARNTSGVRSVTDEMGN
ncbi:MAG: BON domain-containing protein [Candidatus Lustribacter sp.]